MTDLTFNRTVSSADYPTAQSMTIYAGRHLTLNPADFGTITAVSILSQPATGAVIQQDDDSLYINMLDVEAAGNTQFTYRVTQIGGDTDCIVDVDILARNQRHGWGAGEHFLHPLDSDGKWITLQGEGAKTWYISEANGKTAAEISALASVNASDVTGAWLLANYPDYGATEAIPLSPTLGEDLRSAIGNNNYVGAQNTFLLEKGGDYSVINHQLAFAGRSALYPVKVSSYGTGARPILPGGKRTSYKMFYACIEDYDLTGTTGFEMSPSAGVCVAINKVHNTAGKISMQEMEHISINNWSAWEISLTAPKDPTKEWRSIKGDHEKLGSGIYIDDSSGIYIGNCFVDYWGWKEGYNLDLIYDNGDGTFNTEMPPSLYNHNIYIQNSNLDLTVVDNVMTRSASMGIQNRPGGLHEGNFMCRNSFGGNVLGTGKAEDGTPKVQGESNYTLAYRNVVTSNQPLEIYTYPDLDGDGSPDRSVDNSMGAIDRGIQIVAAGSTSLDNLAIHAVDPNNGEVWWGSSYGALISKERHEYYQDATVVNWGEPYSGKQDPIENNTADLTIATLDDYTLLRFQDQRAGLPTDTTTDYLDYINDLRALEDYRGIAKEATDYFQGGLEAAGRTGLVPAVRGTLDTVVFRPDPQGKTAGRRWDFKLDWSTGDYAGFISGDSADMNGHTVDYNIAKASTIATATLGGGGIIASGGRIDITTVSGAGTIGSKLCGIATIDGYSGSDLTITTDGGMVANVGTIAGNCDITASSHWYSTFGDGRYQNQGIVMLATAGESCTISTGKTLEVEGNAIACFDGTAGTATLTFADTSTLKISELNLKVGKIRDMQTGLYGDVAPTVSSVVAIGATCTLDMTGVTAGTHVVMDVGSVTGAFTTYTNCSFVSNTAGVLTVTVP